MMANDGIALKEPAVSLKLKLFRIYYFIIIFQTDTASKQGSWLESKALFKTPQSKT